MLPISIEGLLPLGVDQIRLLAAAVPRITRLAHVKIRQAWRRFPPNKAAIYYRHAHIRPIRDPASCIVAACKTGDLEAVKYIESSFDTALDTLMSPYDDALHGASRNGHLHIVKYITQQNENCEHTDRSREDELWNAEIVAIEAGQLEVVRYLAGLYVPQTEPRYSQHLCRQLEYAAKSGRRNIIEYILETLQATGTVLCSSEVFVKAYESGDPSVLELLYSSRAIIEDDKFPVAAALRAACSSGNVEMVRMLEAHPDAESMFSNPNNFGNCLVDACMHGFAEVAVHLINRFPGPAVLICTALDSGFHLACARGHCAVVRQLIRATSYPRANVFGKKRILGVINNDLSVLQVIVEHYNPTVQELQEVLRHDNFPHSDVIKYVCSKYPVEVLTKTSLADRLRSVIRWDQVDVLSYLLERYNLRNMVKSGELWTDHQCIIGPEMIRYLRANSLVTDDQIRAGWKHTLTLAVWRQCSENLELIKYFHESVGLTPEDLKAIDQYAGIRDPDVMRYLIDNVGVPVNSFGRVCVQKRIECLEVLRHRGFNREHIRAGRRWILREAITAGDAECVKYVVEEFHLTREDIRSRIGGMDCIGIGHMPGHGYPLVDLCKYLARKGEYTQEELDELMAEYELPELI